MKKQPRGFALLSAIFLVVIIAALGLFAVTISSNQQQSSAMDALGSQAYQAAKAGLEWGAYQATRAVPVCNATTTLTTPAGQLSVFTITVECSSTAYTDGTDLFSVYQLKSTAKTTGSVIGSLGYFERQVQVTMRNP